MTPMSPSFNSPLLISKPGAYIPPFRRKLMKEQERKLLKEQGKTPSPQDAKSSSTLPPLFKPLSVGFQRKPLPSFSTPLTAGFSSPSTSPLRSRFSSISMSSGSPHTSPLRKRKARSASPAFSTPVRAKKIAIAKPTPTKETSSPKKIKKYTHLDRQLDRLNAITVFSKETIYAGIKVIEEMSSLTSEGHKFHITPGSSFSNEVCILKSLKLWSKISSACNTLNLTETEAADFTFSVNESMTELLCTAEKYATTEELSRLFRKTLSATVSDEERNKISQLFFKVTHPTPPTDGKPHFPSNLKLLQTAAKFLQADIKKASEKERPLMIKVLDRMRDDLAALSRGEDLCILRNYHATKNAASLISILKNDIQVTHEQEYSGAFVSSTLTERFGSFGLSVSLAHLAARKRSLDHTIKYGPTEDCFDIWSGSSRPLKVEQDIIYYNSHPGSEKTLAELKALLKTEGFPIVKFVSFAEENMYVGYLTRNHRFHPVTISFSLKDKPRF